MMTVKRIRTFVILSISIIALQACTPFDQPFPQPSGPIPAQIVPGTLHSAAVVRMYYATDRVLNVSDGKDPTYGIDRSNEMRFGTCEVSIPREHRMGTLESPSFLRLEFSYDPNKHVTLEKTTLASQDDFFKKLSESLKISKTKSALLFVHGFNVSFADAARRTGQLTYDLGFDGTPAFFSWPSQESLTGYTVDETNMEWAETDFKQFLIDYISRSTAENIYIIAHSLGTRGTTRALTSILKDRPDLQTKVREIILAAPDIDRDTFQREYLPAYIQEKQSVTLYASSLDLGMKASRKVHGNTRVGDTTGGLLCVDGFEPIDATAVSSDFIGHSYYGDANSVVADIFDLVRNRLRANNRPFIHPLGTGTACWSFNTTQPRPWWAWFFGLI